jgi:hypothetical protein
MAAICTFVPWKIGVHKGRFSGDYSLGYSFVTFPPQPIADIDYRRIGLEVGVLFSVVGGLFVLMPSQPRPSSPTTADAAATPAIENAEQQDFISSKQQSASTSELPVTRPEAPQPKNEAPGIPTVDLVIANQELAKAFSILDEHLKKYGDHPPTKIILDAYDWAEMDVALRKGTLGSANMHSFNFANVTVECEKYKCYCHHLLDDSRAREIAKDAWKYYKAMHGHVPKQIHLSQDAWEILNSRFLEFFGGRLTLASQPELASALVNIAASRVS